MKRIGLYVNNWIFGNASFKNMVNRVSNIGFDGIELVGEPSVFRASEVRKLTDDKKLKVISICGMFPGPEKNDLRAFSHPDAKEREKAIDYVKACVDLASGVGARSVLIVPSLVGAPIYFENKEEDLKRSVEPIARAGEYAKQQGKYLTIEPINRYEVCLVNSIDDAIKLSQETGCDYVRAMGDTFHMQIEEADGIPNAIRRAGGRNLQHLHAADNTREAPGFGIMPWRDIIRALYDINYEGVISMEPLPKGKAPYDARKGNIPAEKLDAELKAGLEYLNKQMDIVLRTI